MPFWKLYYHLIWGTHERQPVIGPDEEAVIETTLYAKAAEMRVTLHAIGIVADHMHAVASVPPTVSVAICMKHLKGASSRAVNVRVHPDRLFRWQEGYGALTVGERSLVQVVAYVRNQLRHHQEGTAVALYETMDASATAESSSDDFN